MTRRAVRVDALSVIQVVVAVFLFTLGLIVIIDWSSNISYYGRSLNWLFGRANYAFNVIVGIVELAAGVIICAGLFLNIKSRLLYWVTIVVGILWIVEIIIGFFAQGPFEPDFIVWLNRLAADVIILLALWLINRKYA